MGSNNNSVALQYIKDWGYCDAIQGEKPEKRLKYFVDEFDRWFANFSDEEKIVIEKLLDRFCYYSKTRVNQYLEELHKELFDAHHLKNNDTIYTYIRRRDGFLNSSSSFLNDYKTVNRINKGMCSDDIGNIEESYWKHINNIVFIDDCLGTGDSLKEELEELSKKVSFEGKNIYFVVIHAMENGKAKIGDENGVTVVAKNICKKVFNFEVYGEDWELARDVINKASKRLGISERYKRGYKKSESLMAFSENTPNNTIGIFWQDVEDEYASIFPREEIQRPGAHELKENRKNRRNENHNSKTGA